MRAVRAVRAALPARGAGFLWELEADGLAAGPDFFAAVDFADVAGFFAAVDFPAAIGFLADFAFEEGDEVEVAGFAFVSPEDCAATGVTTISAESSPARNRWLARKTVFGEAKTLISSLYAAFARTQGPGTTCVTAVDWDFAAGEAVKSCPKTHLAACAAVRYTRDVRTRCSVSPGPQDFPHPTAMSTIQPIAGELEPHPDVALVSRVRGGDVSAYDTLVRKYDRQIFRIAQHITQNREDAEDVMQDAFLKAYEKLDQFQGNSKFYTWLVRIAVNESLMRLRKRRTGKMVSIDEDIETEEGSVPRDLADWAPDPEQNYSQSELAEILRKTIQGLPPGFRTVFTLRDVENLSTEETAEALGLSVPAVKSRLLRARLQLRERLSRYFKQSNPLQALEGKSR